jgi:hypothetical protein
MDVQGIGVEREVAPPEAFWFPASCIGCMLPERRVIADEGDGP